MSDRRLQQFEHDDGITGEYLDLIRRNNSHDPAWIAPLENVTRQQLCSEYPFYRDEANRYRRFAVRRDGQLVGHVLATVNARHATDDGPVGALGFLESEQDEDTFRLLIGSATDWLRDACAADQVWATMNFDIWHGYRVMTRGFGEPIFFGEPRNAEWLPEYLGNLGFEVRKRWVSTTVNAEFAAERAPHYRRRYESAMAAGYRIEKLQLRASDDVAALHRVISNTYEHFEGYTPISLSDFKWLLVPFLRFAGTRFASVLRDPQSHPVGFSIAFPDPGELLRDLDGRDDWLHRLKLFRHHDSRRAIYYMIGVLPEARAAHRSLGSALFHHTLRQIAGSDFETITLALLADDSPGRFFALQEVRRAEREYSLFQKVLTAHAETFK